MPNHFHFIARPNGDQLSERMRRLSISYTRAMNKRCGRVGSLFQGPFRAVYVDTDEYPLHVSRYLHLNPVEAGLVERPEDWEFSSYRDYIGLRQGSLPSPDVVLAQFANPAVYQAFVEAYLPGDREVISHLLFDDGWCPESRTVHVLHDDDQLAELRLLAEGFRNPISDRNRISRPCPGPRGCSLHCQ